MAPEMQNEVRGTARNLEGTVTTIVSFFIVLVIGLIVLNEFFDAVDYGEGPFSDVFDDIEAMVASVVALVIILPLIVVAVYAYRYMGRM